MELGLNIGYWGMPGGPDDVVALVREAEVLGYSVVWAAEAYGSDAVSVLSALACATTTIDVGSAVMQIPARTPTMTAMTAATLDALSEGRFRLGLGVSGPQVSEGWHGVRFARPLARTREYVDVVQRALSREEVTFSGEFFELPLPDGPGKPLHLMLHPVREHIPLYLGAIGPRNLELAGEIADGWLPVFFAPQFADDSLHHLEIGRKRSASDRFDIAPTVPLVVGRDVGACADPVRPYAALYVGGMGSRDQNFYHSLAVRMGFATAADEVQRRYLAGDCEGAAVAVPTEFVDATSLLGDTHRLADRIADFARAGVTTLNVMPYGADTRERIGALTQAAHALELSGLG